MSQRLVPLPPKYTGMESLSETYKEDPNSVVYINPVSKLITRGEERMSVGYKPTYDEPIVNFETYGKQHALVESGKQGDFKGLGGFTKEWYPKAMEVISAWKSGGKQGLSKLAESGMLTGADFATVKSALLALKTTETPIRNHIILELVTRMQSDRLDLRIDDFAGFDAINEDMGVWTIPLSGKGGFTSQTFSQKKYGWHLQWSEDFTMQYYDVDVMGYHVRALRGQMEKVMNQKCAALFNALSATAQGSWSAFSGGLSTRNAKIDVKNIATVVDNTLRGTPQAILSNRAVYDVYQSNTTVQPGGLGAFANVRYTFGNGIITGTGGFESIRWGVDDLITTDRYTVFDPIGIVFVEGPQRTAQYEDSRTGIRGTIFKRWFTAKIIDTAVFNTGSTIL
ncbi:hypothetical protein [Glutamicibacter sp.]|jgi:hypothetical protein|uniref:hypothetical protein n=1 Tax=Glutamicibacter sp. TaxID=1931995 RepID=UPI002B47C77F|nr:hypothetical protein [Glutamicibacter sp.]HJX79127.1 hypothetical protein [Glutamicibacter sp.]